MLQRPNSTSGMLKTLNKTTNKSDHHTIANAFWEFLALLCGLTIDLGLFLDDCAGSENEKTILRTFSTNMFFIALTISLLASISSTYCHWVLNKNNQKPKKKEPIALEDPDTGEVIVPIQDQPLLAGLPDENKEEVPTLENTKLICLQKLALIGDRFSHINETTTSFIGLIEVIHGGYGLSRPVKITLQAMALLAGIHGSTADNRTCRENLLKYNYEYTMATMARH